MKAKVKRIRTLSRPLRHTLAYFLIKSTLALVSYLPLAWSQMLGRTLGLVCARLLSKHSQLIKRQLEQTLLKDQDIELDSSALLNKCSQSTTGQHQLQQKTTYECEHLMRAHWQDLGQRLFEWFSAKRALSLFHISPSQREQLKQIQERAKMGKAQVIMSAHFAQWELMASFLSQKGFSYIAVASALPKGPFGAWLGEYRKELGVKVVHPNGGAKKIKKTLEQGGVIALLIDHSTLERSVRAPFLGKKAPLSLTADRLIASFDAEVHWLSNYRDNQGQYQIILQKLCPIQQDTTQADPTGIEINVKSSSTLSTSNVLKKNSDTLDNKTLSPSTYTVLAHKLLEKQVQDRPEQWLWLHQKWAARQDHDQ